jgi:hypothetical protein
MLFLLGLLPKEALGQRFQTDSIFLSKAIGYTREIYTTAMAGDAHLYNGVEYKEYNLQRIDVGHPFFLSGDWEEGSIQYDGQVYQPVELLYDLVNEVIVIEHAYSHFKIELINEKIRAFTLMDHNFVRLVNDAPDKYAVPTGLYDVLYDGQLKLFARRKKKAFDDVKNGKPIKMFLTDDQFFVYKNGKYFPVKTKSSVMEVLSDRKVEIKKFLAKNKVRFRKNPESALIQSVRFYDYSFACYFLL